jgi:hypothetical protein
LLGRGESFHVYLDNPDIADGLKACRVDGDPELLLLPADRMYRLPRPVTVGRHQTDMACESLGSVFLVFRSLCAAELAAVCDLELDDSGEAPDGPDSLADLLEVDGAFEVDDRESCEPEPSHVIYSRYQEFRSKGSTHVYVRERWIVARESSLFPGYTLLGQMHDAYFAALD